MLVVTRGGSIVAHGNAAGQGNVLSGGARARARSALHDALQSVLSAPAELDAYTTHLEACAVALSQQDYTAYMAMMSRVIYNLKESNGLFIVTTFPVSKVCRISHKRLNAQTAHAQRDANIEERMQLLMRRCKEAATRATDAASSLDSIGALQCPSCKGKDEIKPFQAVMRSADEGMVTRCICKCGHTWKLAS